MAGNATPSRKQLAQRIDASVFPGLHDGPQTNVVAAAAISLRKAAEPESAAYARQVLANAKAMAAALLDAGVELVAGGTDNHTLVIDTLASAGMDGRRAEELLDRIGVTTNKQVIPDGPNPPLRPSGIRLGTPACTTREMKEADMLRIAGWIVEAPQHADDESRLDRMERAVRDFCSGFPVPGVAN